MRAAECCIRLARFEECRAMCDRGLEADPRDEIFLKLRKEATAKEKEKERNRRKEAAAEKKKRAEEEKLLEAIRYDMTIKLGYCISECSVDTVRPRIFTFFQGKKDHCARNYPKGGR